MKQKEYKQKELLDLGLRVSYLGSEYAPNGVLISSYADLFRIGKAGVKRKLSPLTFGKKNKYINISFHNGKDIINLSYFRTLYCLTTCDLGVEDVVIRIDKNKPLNDFNNLKCVSKKEYFDIILKEKRKKR